MQARYYDPYAGRFLATDPVSASTASFNRYWYANNNPYKNIDPDGRNPIAGAAAGCALTGPACPGGAVVGAAVGIIVAAVGVAIYNEITEDSADPQPSPEAVTDEASKGEAKPGQAFPDRALPRSEGGEPMADPEAEGAYTQLGRKEGRNGSYPQAREFDKDGKPVRDIDFTDHGRPGNHTNPHQHPYRDNPTGGTRQRSRNAEPLPKPEVK
jgi:uncharacterized protein RhaS with RHS repeats